MAGTLQLDELTFEGRNKSYGAYALRKSYDKHANTAIILSMAFSLFLISLPTIIRRIKGAEYTTPLN